MVWLAMQAIPQFGHCKTSQSCFGFGATPCGTFITNFTACTCGGARKWRNGRGMVVRFNLHEDMVQCVFFDIRTTIFCHETLYFVPRHDGRIVRISHHGVLWIFLMGVANHAEQTVVLILAINRELGIENFVTAMLTVGLREHHQFNIAWIASKLLEGS